MEKNTISVPGVPRKVDFFTFLKFFPALQNQETTWKICENRYVLEVFSKTSPAALSLSILSYMTFSTLARTLATKFIPRLSK